LQASEVALLFCFRVRSRFWAWVSVSVRYGFVKKMIVIVFPPLHKLKDEA
jgi:hypothetical protein